MQPLKPLLMGVLTTVALVPLETRGQSILKRLEERVRAATPTPAPPPAPTPSSTSAPTPAVAADQTSANPPRLGVQVVPLTADGARHYDLPVRQGVLVVSVESDSAAQQAGLTVGSAIVAINGRRIDTPRDLMQRVQSVGAGQVIELTYYQGRRLRRSSIPLQGAPAPAAAVPPPPPTAPVETPTPAPAADPRSSLERQLGGGGSRPLLGTIGRVIDGLATQNDARPATPPTPNGGRQTLQIERLQAQLESLQAQVENLQQRVLELERSKR